MKQNRKQISDCLRERLTDARDGRLAGEELDQLKQEVMAHDPRFWKDHLWMMKQAQGGVFARFADLRDAQPAEGSIRRFHARREAEGGTESDLEYLVWSWFRRYVLSVGLVLIVLLAGLQMGTSDEPVGDTRDQMSRMLGWEQEQHPELDHWLYDGL